MWPHVYVICACLVFLSVGDLLVKKKPLHVSSRRVVHHQEDQPCRHSNWYSYAFILTGCWQDPTSSQPT